MGTGKTEVGQRVAYQLDWSFIDTDARVEQARGQSITRIFAAEGEAAFRQAEREALRDILTAEDVVIATGGGAIIDADNRQRMKAAGFLVALTAPAELIHQRLKESGDRPLLQVADPYEEIQRLLRERQSFYEESDYVIDTAGKDAHEVAQEIIDAYAKR